MQTQEDTVSIYKLQRLLSRRDHAGFLAAISAWVTHNTGSHTAYLRALAGEGLCLLMAQEETPSSALLSRYGELLLTGAVVAPAEIVDRIANCLGSDALAALASEFRVQEPAQRSQKPDFHQSNSASQRPIIQVRRIVQAMHMIASDELASDILGIKRSIFRSQQERTFIKALSLRFPALLALPNYPLDQIVELSRLRGALDEEVLSYGQRCRMDAVLVIPDEGDPVAAFELDSAYHDRGEVRKRDAMKDQLFKAIGLPFYRLRVDSPTSMTSDEWYALLTDEVVPTLDLGRRIRCRQAAYSLVPS